MAKEKILYWLGTLVGTRRVGSIKAGGKLYSIGEPFPADKVPAKRLAVFKKDGCVASIPFPVADSGHDDAKDKDMALLQGRIAGLTEKLKTDGDTIAGLQLELEAVGDATEIKKQVVELDSEIERLTGENSELSNDNEEKAALIKDQKAEIKALKKDVK